MSNKELISYLKSFVINKEIFNVKVKENNIDILKKYYDDMYKKASILVMDDEYVEEMAGKELDQFSLYKNNLIIYNSSMEHTKIDKLCNTIDVLPTVLNLFGIDYDSRLMAGKDILSNSPGLVIFADYSWLNDKGKYSYDTKTFTPSNGEVSDEYIEKMNNEVSNKYLISRNILIYDYYKLAYDTLK